MICLSSQKNKNRNSKKKLLLRAMVQKCRKKQIVQILTRFNIFLKISKNSNSFEDFRDFDFSENVLLDFTHLID